MSDKNYGSELDEILDDWFMKSKEQLKAKLSALLRRVEVEGRKDETQRWRTIAEASVYTFKKMGVDATTIPIKGHLESIDNRLEQLEAEL